MNDDVRAWLKKTIPDYRPTDQELGEISTTREKWDADEKARAQRARANPPVVIQDGQRVLLDMGDGTADIPDAVQGWQEFRGEYLARVMAWYIDHVEGYEYGK